jgi:hypothetical protein
MAPCTFSIDQQACRNAAYHANSVLILLSLCKSWQSCAAARSLFRGESMRNEHEASRSGRHKAIDEPIDLPDRSGDLNIRSGALIALWIACDHSALRLRMRKRAPSADEEAARMASPSARSVTRSAVRLPSQAYTANTGLTWRSAARTPRPLRPLAVARAPHGGAAPGQIAGLTNQSGASASRTLHFPLLACGDRHLVRAQV